MIQDVEIKELRNIITLVKDMYNYDFGEYAISSFKRRIIRIFEIFKFNTVDELLVKIKTDKVFVEEFVKEVTVNTTEMFRDPTFWRKLRDDILPILSSNTNIRIWHAACSSGEEVYSMAILLKEMGLYDKAIITASDINEDVIKTAKSGIYPARNMDLNQSNYERYGGKYKLDDYYKEVKDGNVQFDSKLISNVTFKRFDLVLGAPFSKFDIILCRNVMIYFNLELQDRVVAKFSESLFKNAFFAVGQKETIAWCKAAKSYSTYSIEEKIYRKVLD